MKAQHITDNEPESVAHTKPETFMMVQELNKMRRLLLKQPLKNKYRKDIGL